VQAIMSQG